MSKQYSLEDLVYLMSRLRHPQTGCPWDLKQNFKTIIPYTIEESYEVADAIARENWSDVSEELGDLLFQVIFYSQLGKEQQLFTLSDVISGIVTKLIRRHPHVFPEGTLVSERTTTEDVSLSDVSTQWSDIKESEKASQNASSVRLLDSINNGMPPLARAIKLQKKASTVGFDWPDSPAIIGKIEEELSEVVEALESGDISHLEKEIGDLLFAVTNLARHYRIDPEVALTGTNNRFYQRFSHVEDRMIELGGWTSVTLSDMETAWQEAKQIESRKD